MKHKSSNAPAASKSRATSQSKSGSGPSTSKNKKVAAGKARPESKVEKRAPKATTEPKVKVGHGGFRGKGDPNTDKKMAKGEQSQQLTFITSAANISGCPTDQFPEIAMVGRSNAGKSSLVNAMANSRIAMVSQTPGKTRLLNFFQGPSYRLVDMPGYGFTKRFGNEINDWRKLIETYLATRTQLVGLFLVMDIRREWTTDEQNLLDWLSPRDLPCCIVLTKADKLSNNEIRNAINRVRKAAQRESVFAVSSTKREGLFEFEDYAYTNWVKGFAE